MIKEKSHGPRWRLSGRGKGRELGETTGEAEGEEARGGSNDREEKEGGKEIEKPLSSQGISV